MVWPSCQCYRKSSENRRICFIKKGPPGPFFRAVLIYEKLWNWGALHIWKLILFNENWWNWGTLPFWKLKACGCSLWCEATKICGGDAFKISQKRCEKNDSWNREPRPYTDGRTKAWYKSTVWKLLDCLRQRKDGGPASREKGQNREETALRRT